MNGPVKTVLVAQRRQHHPHERVDADHGEHGQRAEAADAARGEAPPIGRVVPRGRPSGGLDSTRPPKSSTCCSGRFGRDQERAVRHWSIDRGESVPRRRRGRGRGSPCSTPSRSRSRAIRGWRRRRYVRAEHLRGVDRPPSVITQMTSNSLMPLSRLSVMTSVTGRSIGTVTERSCCHPLAPSARAASYSVRSMLCSPA